MRLPIRGSLGLRWPTHADFSMIETIALAFKFCIAAFVTFVVTELLRVWVHRRREAVNGLGGTQDIAFWGTLVAGLFVVAALVAGIVFLIQRYF